MHLNPIIQELFDSQEYLTSIFSRQIKQRRLQRFCDGDDVFSAVCDAVHRQIESPSGLKITCSVKAYASRCGTRFLNKFQEESQRIPLLDFSNFEILYLDAPEREEHSEHLKNTLVLFKEKYPYHHKILFLRFEEKKSWRCIALELDPSLSAKGNVAIEKSVAKCRQQGGRAIERLRKLFFEGWGG